MKRIIYWNIIIIVERTTKGEINKKSKITDQILLKIRIYHTFKPHWSYFLLEDRYNFRWEEWFIKNDKIK